MKLTTKKLKQIIAEEVLNVLGEAERGDLGSPKRQRKYGSTDIGDILIAPAGGGSSVPLDQVLDELDAMNLDLSKTRLGWHAIVWDGTEEELRAQLVENADLSSLLARIHAARQRITERWGSTTHRYVYPFRVRGREEGGLSVAVSGGDIIELGM